MINSQVKLLLDETIITLIENLVKYNNHWNLYKLFKDLESFKKVKNILSNEFVLDDQLSLFTTQLNESFEKFMDGDIFKLVNDNEKCIMFINSNEQLFTITEFPTHDQNYKTSVLNCHTKILNEFKIYKQNLNFDTIQSILLTNAKSDYYSCIRFYKLKSERTSKKVLEVLKINESKVKSIHNELVDPKTSHLLPKLLQFIMNYDLDNIKLLIQDYEGRLFGELLESKSFNNNLISFKDEIKEQMLNLIGPFRFRLSKIDEDLLIIRTSGNSFEYYVVNFLLGQKQEQFKSNSGTFISILLLSLLNETKDEFKFTQNITSIITKCFNETKEKHKILVTTDAFQYNGGITWNMNEYNFNKSIQKYSILIKFLNKKFISDNKLNLHE